MEKEQTAFDASSAGGKVPERLRKKKKVSIIVSAGNTVLCRKRVTGIIKKVCLTG